MADWKRADRVAGELHRALDEVFREGLKDPRIGALSILGVRLSDDLGIAHVTWAPLGGQGDEREIAAGLEAARGYLRREVARRVKLRHMPSLVFHLDTALDSNLAMVRLLEDLERGEGEPEDGG